MARLKKKNKLKRYLLVSKRKIKRLNRKKILRWFKANLKQHPFILAILFFIWLNAILAGRIFTSGHIAGLLRFHLTVFVFWVVLVVLSNLLKDKQKVKWYLKKRFVFFLLLLAAPLGLIFLWSGSRFKKITKAIFTIIFSLAFVFLYLRHNRQYENKSPIDNIVETIASSKKKTFLKRADASLLGGLKLIRPQRPPDKLAISEIASRCSPSVVVIKTKNKYGREIGIGTGFIISKDGIIVTNFHVTESAYQAEIEMKDKIFEEVYFVKGVPRLDIAILKVNASDLPFLSIGDSDALIDGQFVTVLGNPAGFERSVSNGIISAIRAKGNMKVIQMTAPVSPGSSGGPVLNEYGEVIGITTLASFFMAQNLNFAIPINYLQKIIKEAQDN